MVNISTTVTNNLTMGFFDKLFGKKANADNSQPVKGLLHLPNGETYIAIGETVGFRIVRPLTVEQKEKIEKSTIILRTGQLYMHYWTENLVCKDRTDPEWQNKVMFFWKAEEPFPKKSLPPEFETFKTKHFLFTIDSASKITCTASTAIPWFGMPGYGEKYGCKINGQEVTIPELFELGFVEYLEQVELTAENTDILTNQEDYFFLIDERITPFQNGHFYMKGNPISIEDAYSIGGIHIVKKITLNN